MGTASTKASDRPSSPAVRRPRRDGTREKILDVAIDLFNDQGYDKTSLREIAEKLGFTKAALYYHFPSKEDILLALHLRLHDVGRELVGRLSTMEAGQEGVRQWSRLLDDFIDEVVSNRKIFMLHERNQQAFQKLHSQSHTEEHDDIERELQRFLSQPGMETRDRVRLACSLGAVMGVLMAPQEIFKDIPTNELTRSLRQALRDFLLPYRRSQRTKKA